MESLAVMELVQRSHLDDLDRKIIACLTEDGRLSASEIAVRLGTASERTVRNRISALLQNRHIVISAIPDPTSMGDGVKADLMIEVEPGMVESVALALGEHDEIGYLAAMAGPYNLTAAVILPSHAALLDFCETTVAGITGVRRVEPQVVLRMYKVFGTRTNAVAHKVAGGGDLK